MCVCVVFEFNQSAYSSSSSGVRLVCVCTVPYRTTSECDMHNNHGGRGSPGGHTAVHHHHQGHILPRNRCALMCIDKHDDDVHTGQASAREDQPGSGADGEYEATDDRYPS